MTDSVKPPEPTPVSNVIDMDRKRLDKLKDAPYFSVLDEAELLRVKFQHGKIDNAHDAYRFVTLVKYIIQYGHSEAIRYSYQLIYDQFMQGL